MRAIFISLVFLFSLLGLRSLCAQNTATKYQVISFEESPKFIETVDHSKQGISYSIDEENPLYKSNAIAVEITVTSDYIPYHILKALLKTDYFDVSTNSNDRQVVIGIQQPRNAISYKGSEEVIQVSYKIQLPEKAQYVEGVEEQGDY